MAVTILLEYFHSCGNFEGECSASETDLLHPFSAQIIIQIQLSAATTQVYKQAYIFQKRPIPR